MEPRYTSDVVVIGRGSGQAHVLLIQRRWDPYKGQWALPGGHVDPGGKSIDAGRRELAKETGLKVGKLRYIGTWDEAGRDPRGPYYTDAYLAQVADLPTPRAGDDAKNAKWCLKRDVMPESEIIESYCYGPVLVDHYPEGTYRLRCELPRCNWTAVMTNRVKVAIIGEGHYFYHYPLFRRARHGA